MPTVPLRLWRRQVVIEFDDNVPTLVRDPEPALIEIRAPQPVRAPVPRPARVPVLAISKPQRRRRVPLATKLLVAAGLLLALIALAPRAFYRFDHHWIKPTVVSASDERVLALHTQLAQQSILRERLRAERATLVADLDDTTRIIALQEAFQDGFGRSLRADLGARRAELRKLEQLTQRYLDVAPQIVGARREMPAAGGEKAAELAQSNLELVERKVDLQARTRALTRETQSLRAAVASLRGTHATDALGYDALRLEQEYHRSVAEAARARDHREALRRGIAAIDGSIAECDRILAALQKSPYLQALEHDVTLAFVPYDNLGATRPGSPLYGCRLEMVGCQKVGSVVGPVGGEVSDRDRRGVMVQIALDDPGAVQREVLFAGRRPLFL